MRMLATALLAAVLTAPAAEAQVRPPGQQQQRRAGMERQVDRAAMEAQIMQRFLETTTQRMGLSQDGTQQLAAILRRSGQERRTMHQQSEALQQRLQEAVRAGAGDAEVRGMIEEITALRRREFQLWEREQRELGQLLTPRQHAMYMVQWLRLQDNIRSVMARREDGPPPPSQR